MPALSRRKFLSLTGSAAAATLSGHFTTSADAAMGPADKFDLVIKGGDVLDPSQSLRGKRDIGIRWGAIEAVENDIPAARALKTIDASGKLVTPGLIYLHSHVYPYGSAIGIPADELAQFQCTTTAQYDRIRSFIALRFASAETSGPSLLVSRATTPPVPTGAVVTMSLSADTNPGFPALELLADYLAGTLAWAENAGLGAAEHDEIEHLADSLLNQLKSLRHDIQERVGKQRQGVS